MKYNIQMYMCMQQHANYGMTLIARVTPGNTTIKISRRLIYLPSLILNFYYVRGWEQWMDILVNLYSVIWPQDSSKGKQLLRVYPLHCFLQSGTSNNYDKIVSLRAVKGKFINIDGHPEYSSLHSGKTFSNKRSLSP